jgi:hypothetical protein
MPKVLTTKEIEGLQESYSDKMFLTLTKVKQYKLEPYGKFCLKWKQSKNETPNQIWIAEVDLDHSEAMPMSELQEKAVVKMMKQFKTDILTDGSRYFTRTNSGLTPIRHKKLSLYANDEAFKELVDDGHSFGKKE